MQVSTSTTPFSSLLTLPGAVSSSSLAHGSDPPVSAARLGSPPGSSMASLCTDVPDLDGNSTAPVGHPALAQFHEERPWVLPRPAEPVAPSGFSTNPPLAVSQVMGVPLEGASG